MTRFAQLMPFERFAAAAECIRLENHGCDWEVRLDGDTVSLEVGTREEALRGAHFGAANNPMFLHSEEGFESTLDRYPERGVLPIPEVVKDYPLLAERFPALAQKILTMAGGSHDAAADVAGDEFELIVPGFRSLVAVPAAGGHMSFHGHAVVNGRSYFARIMVSRREDGTSAIGLSDAAFETLTGRPVVSQCDERLEDLLTLAKRVALTWADGR